MRLLFSQRGRALLYLPHKKRTFHTQIALSYDKNSRDILNDWSFLMSLTEARIKAPGAFLKDKILVSLNILSLKLEVDCRSMRAICHTAWVGTCSKNSKFLLNFIYLHKFQNIYSLILCYSLKLHYKSLYLLEDWE